MRCWPWCGSDAYWVGLARGARGVAHWVVRAGRRAWRGVGESGEYWPLEGYYLRLPGVLDIRIA